MRLTNRKLKRREEGNALLREFAAVSTVVIPLFFGMVGAGIQLGRMNEAVQILPRRGAHVCTRRRLLPNCQPEYPSQPRPRNRDDRDWWQCGCYHVPNQPDLFSRLHPLRASPAGSALIWVN